MEHGIIPKHSKGNILIVLPTTMVTLWENENPFSNKYDRTTEFLVGARNSWAVENKLRAGLAAARRQYRQVGRPQLACRRQCLNNPQGTLLIDSSLVRRKCD